MWFFYGRILQQAQCYEGDASAPIPGIKDENSDWNVKGHPDRIIHVTKKELAVFAKLFDGNDNWKQAKLPQLHVVQLVDALRVFADQSKTIATESEKIYTAEMWHETNNQIDGTIERNVDFPESVIKRAAARLNMFYDCVLIDEFQDFREYDYELIMALAKQLEEVVLVGDYHQHSVSGTHNSGKPFKDTKGEVSYDDFVASIIKKGFIVDASTLAKSRRCSIDVCNYVSQKLGIGITSNGDHTGSVIWVDDAVSVLNNNQITKLVFQEAANYSFRALNWSYSKGDTVDSACVILTDNLDNLDSDKFNPDRLSPSTRNKLYVAMTRSRGDLYLMKASTFKAIKDDYRIH